MKSLTPVFSSFGLVSTLFLVSVSLGFFFSSSSFFFSILASDLIFTSFLGFSFDFFWFTSVSAPSLVCFFSFFLPFFFSFRSFSNAFLSLCNLSCILAWN
ncbi:unnamed protein product [Meloidogyne enterolobii]|uniref:Uncharacterized protein n=1 Tax=Meloidogyne enterolobii TaxID=390850 RepID=A0ACB1AV62_MELEN